MSATPEARNTNAAAPRRYGRVSVASHWLNAAAFLAALALGLVLAYGGLAREAAGGLRVWHKLFGVLALAFGLWRAGWRLFQGFPKASAAAPAWQRAASRAVHKALLAAVVAMPLSGVLMSAARGRAVDVWGVTLLPALGETPWLSSLAAAVHEMLPLAVVALLALHIGGALLHHFILRDDTLRAMIPARS